MPRRRWIVAVVTAVAAVGAASAARAEPLIYRGFVGSLNNFNSFGELGFVHGTAVSGNPSEGNFGAIFDSVVTANSITIDQRVDESRHRMRQLRIYTSPYQFVTAELADAQGPQTITLPGAGLASDYFFINVMSLYGAGAVDDNPGLHALSFDGTVGPARTNLNAFLSPEVTNQFDPEMFFFDVLTNQMNVSTTGGPADYVFFEHADATDRTIKVNYPSPQTVASVGLAFEGQILFSYNSRPIPKFVTITDSNGNQREVTLSPDTLQYGQYPLSSPLTNTTSLTLTLPVGTENYYIPELFDPNHPTSTLVGVVEFEAFADAVMPPAENPDFNGDGNVDGSDFLIWQRGLGAGGGQSAGDANGDGIIDGADLSIWAAQFGSAAATPAVGAVPEPAGAPLVAIFVALSSAMVRRRRGRDGIAPPRRSVASSAARASGD